AGWRQLFLRRGATPLAELAAQVARLGVGAEELLAAIRADPAALRRVLYLAVDSAAGLPAESAAQPAAVRRGGQVVLVIDQIEELFTQGSTDTDRLAMLRALIYASESSGSAPAPAVVVLGLRADFYDHCARIPALVPYLQDSSLVLVPAMTAADPR